MNHPTTGADVSARDSLNNPAFSVTLSQGCVTLAHQRRICMRARNLYDELLAQKRMLNNLYGGESDVLFKNFADILRYAENDLEASEARGTASKADYFDRLSSFCGQIEKVLRLTRVYQDVL